MSECPVCGGDISLADDVVTGELLECGDCGSRPRHVGRWRPNAAALCRAVAAERGRAMSGGGGRTRPRHVGRWRPNAAASCRAVAAARGRTMSGCPNGPR